VDAVEGGVIRRSFYLAETENLLQGDIAFVSKVNDKNVDIQAVGYENTECSEISLKWIAGRAMFRTK
jgi:hypothetical protein